ncbi:MAG: hypothetical protein LBH43_17990 [Treponema sp.]|nr:hypothetical protein [Treponema sp.]
MKLLEAFVLKNTIETFLAQYADGRYAVISAVRKFDAESVFEMPHVSVYYSSGSFDNSKSSVNSPYHHDVSFNIYLYTAAKATVNLAILQNPSATQAQAAAALAASENASLLVDGKTDELLSVLFDIIMRPAHRNLGTDYITNRWITQIKKYNPETLGSIVTATASITLTAQCEEEVTSEEGKPSIPGNGVDTIVDLGDESKQGAVC